MSQSISADLLSQFSGSSLSQISQQVGASEQQTSQAINAALPLLLGALGKNAAEPGGAQALFGALQRDHAGGNSPLAAVGGLDIGGLLGSLLGGTAGSSNQASAAPQLNAEGILGHILGGNLSQAQGNLSQATGLNAASIQKLLTILAPIVMSYLGKQVMQGKASSADELGSMLGQERSQIQQQGGLAGNLLNSVLDQNGDGKLDVGDLLKFGTSLLNRK